MTKTSTFNMAKLLDLALKITITITRIKTSSAITITTIILIIMIIIMIIMMIIVIVIMVTMIIMITYITENQSPIR